MGNAIELSVKRIIKLDGNGATKAFCDVLVAEAFLIKGVRVVDGKNGLFVSMPREQGKNGRWYETMVPMSQGIRDHLSQLVLAAYSANGSPDV